MKILLSAILFLVLLSPSIFGADVYVFSSPENSYSGLSQFVENENFFNISVYEFTSPEIAELVSGKVQNVLVEEHPVGGMKDIEEKILCYLESRGIKIRLYNKTKSILHAKYIIGKNILVSSENFGQGFFENKGWEAIIEDEKTTNKFRKVFDEDFRTSENFECRISDFKFSLSQNFPKNKITKYENQEVESVFAPENAVEKVLNLLDSANKSIYIEQFYIYKNWGTKKNPKPNLFLEKVLEKARQGIEVKILLDSNSYNIEKSDLNSNLNTVDFLKNVAEKENLKLEAKLADLENLGVDKIHNKGVIIDEKTVLVSSINWNENSPKRNRETGIIIHGEAAQYFVDLFKKDFEGNKTTFQQTDNSGLTGKIVSGGIELALIIVITIIIYGAFSYFRSRKNIS